jgi:uncharacterized membrane protein YqhA
MTKFIVGTRYLVIIPVIGLALAAAALFVFGGYGLIRLVVQQVLMIFGLMESHESDVPVFVELVEYVHTFLIGTVLYITAVGFFQLFIKEISFPEWLRIDSTEELETNLIGVTVVVLAVNFMARAFTDPNEAILQYGVGIALPIAAMAFYVAMRAWANKVSHDEAHSRRSEGQSID